MRLVLVGPPGAGKGTQARAISARFDIPHVSTGEIFRAHVAVGTDLGRQAKAYMDAGELVPDQLTIAMVRERLSEPDAKSGFLLDGFPRTVTQAVALDEMLADLGMPLTAVLELQVDDEEVVRRLSGRRTCESCGHTAHAVLDPPATPGVCDLCGGELAQRDDDQPETVRRRLQVYAEQTAPVVDYYRATGLLVPLAAVGPIDEVTERAISALSVR